MATTQPAAEKAEPSDLAIAIAEATSSTPELIDRIIGEHARVVCSYCGDATVEQMAVKDGVWTTDARELMQAHMLTCPKRPERKLVDLVDVLADAAKFCADLAEEELVYAKVGTGAEVALRHIARKARAALAQLEELRKGE